MNCVQISGRLTKDPMTSWTQGREPMCVARFNLAIDRPPKKDGKKDTDFPSVVVFGRQAENAERFLKKGDMVAIEGRLQTGSYEKQGVTVYTTDVIANRVEYLVWGRDRSEAKSEAPARSRDEDIQDMFEQLDSEVPF